MNQAPSSTSRFERAVSWLAARARSPEGTIAIYALLAIAALIAAYFTLFSQFATYDDEGTVLVTLNAFTHGETLYRDVYTPFGPFYYELFGAFFKLAGLDVTTDASRSIVLVIWVGASLLFGVSVQRLTRRLSLGAAAMMVAFTVLFILSQEPMHAQVLAVALLSLFTLLLTFLEGRRVLALGVACGALLAALVLTKVNLGIYAVAAVAFAAALTIGPLERRWWVRWPIVAAFLVLPFVVTGRDLSTEPVRELAVLELLAGAAIATASWSLRLGPTDAGQERSTVRWLLGASAGFVFAFSLILAVIFVTGSSPSDVYDGVVTQALRIRDVNPAPLIPNAAAIDWAIAAVAAAGVISWWRLRPGGPPGQRALLVEGALRAAAGLAIWFSISQSATFAFGPGPGNPDILALLLAWVAVIPPRIDAPSAQMRFLRALLPALAVAEVLQVYPVAGSQMRIAAVMFVAVGGLCLGDALLLFRAWNENRGPLALQRFGVIATVAIVALGVKFAVDGVIRVAITKGIAYDDQPALKLHGATDLHLPEAEAEAYERMVELLHRYRCSTFIGYANVDSLYLWSQIDPPRPSAPSAWMLALDEDEQNRILRELRATPRPCVVRNESVAEAWLAGRPRPDTPLVNYIFDEFEVLETVGPFEFMVPKGTS